MYHVDISRCFLAFAGWIHTVLSIRLRWRNFFVTSHFIIIKLNFFIADEKETFTKKFVLSLPSTWLSSNYLCPYSRLDNDLA